MGWNEDSERFIAFFDIKGFKDYVNRNNHKYIKERIRHLVCYARGSQDAAELNYGALIRTVCFSDSICIISNGKAKEDFDAILDCSYYLLLESYFSKIPLIGGISLGYLTADIENSIFFGQPLIDAYKISEDLCYYGVVLDGNVDKYIFDFKIETEKLYKGKTKFKNGEATHNNISPIYYTGNDYLAFKNEVEMMSFTASGSVRKYAENTLEMLKKMNEDKMKKL